MIENEPKFEKKEEMDLGDILERLKNKKEESENYDRFETLERLPPKMREKVNNYTEMLEEAGVESEDILERATKYFAEEVQASYLDRRFEIPNKSYLRIELVRIIDDLIEKNKIEDKLEEVAILSFDVNGLKAVNDLSGHDNGDIYLQRIVEVLKSGETSQVLKESGFDIFLSSNGGDEFSIVVDSKFNLIDGGREVLLDKLLEKYKNEIEQINCEDLINFNNPDIRRKFTKFDIDVPEDFSFTASVSAGASILKEGIGSINPDDFDEYHKILENIMGEMIDISDKRSMEDKERFKKELKEGGDRDRFLSKVLKRNEETIRSELEIERLEEELERLKLEIKESNEQE